MNLRRRRPVVEPAPDTTPTVRDTHIAYVASLTDDQLRGDPDVPVIITGKGAP